MRYLFLFAFYTLAIMSVKAQSAVDYSQASNWAALPTMEDNADLVPGGLKTDKQGDSEVDVFFVYPTSYTRKMENGQWNALLDDVAVNQETDEKSIKYQASLFNQVGKIYAPRYRQANIAAYFTGDEAAAKKAFDLAYKDISDAFDYYIRHYSQNRPFIIASHSQGSTHAMKLIRDKIQGTPLEKRMIVAYLAGMPVSKNYLRIPPCSDAGQFNCICSWRTFLDGYIPEYIRNEDPVIVTNPITWSDKDTYSEKKDHKGAVLFNFDQGPVSGIISAKVEGNVLWIKKPDIKGKMLLRRKNYHVGDFNLFYKDIQENALLRKNNFLQKS